MCEKICSKKGIDRPYRINIMIVVEEHMSSENKHSGRSL